MAKKLQYIDLDDKQRQNPYRHLTPPIDAPIHPHGQATDGPMSKPRHHTKLDRLLTFGLEAADVMHGSCHQVTSAGQQSS